MAAREFEAEAPLACEARLHDLEPGGFFLGRFTMQFPPEVLHAEPWGDRVYTFDVADRSPVTCELSGARAALTSATMYRLQTRGESLSDERLTQLALAPINPRSYSPKGCDRERRECWRREATVTRASEPLVTQGEQGRRLELIIDIGGGADEERVVTRMSVLGMELGSELYVVTLEAPLVDWHALKPSIDAAKASFAPAPGVL